MRRNRQPAALANDVADRARRFSFQIRKLRADAKKVTVGGRYLDSGENEEIIDGQTVQPHQAFLKEVIDGVTRVVIGDRDPVQPFGARGGDQVFRTGNTVPGKKGMRVQVDIERHCQEVNLEDAKWKALVSRNGA